MEKAVLDKYKKEFEYDLFEKVIPFWVNYGFDKKQGGINTCLSREGRLFSDEKSVWMQGRGGWMMAHICNVFGGHQDCKEMAKSALEFAKKYCIDPADGRMYFVVGTDGTPVRKRRYNASEHFYIMANAEYYGLTGEKEYLDEARKYHKFVVDMYNDPASDPYKITPKFLPTAPAMRGLCGELLLMEVTRCLRLNDPERASEYIELEKKLVNNILKYYYLPQFGCLFESVGPNGEYISTLTGGRTINPGHNMENVWCLLCEAEELGMPEIVEQIETIYAGAVKHGWDSKYGGFLYFVDSEGFPPQAYEHDMKLWWVHTEAMISAIKLYRITGKEKYWDDFVKYTDYCFAHFRDAEYGEWYGYLRREGLPTEPIAKGNVFKGPFHVPRMYAEVIEEFNKL